MMTQEFRARPPRIAAWLVDLFAPDETETIAGDLLEEFSELASKLGVTSARRWYRRQSVKTIAHLFATAFRDAPWLIACTTVAGYYLFGFGYGLPERVIVAILNLHRHGVVPYFTQSQMDFHIFWLNSGIYVGRLLVSLLVGCIVAMAAKGREMVAAMTLGFITAGLPWAGYLLWAAKHRDAFPPAFLPFLVNILGGSVLIVVGGGIVRKIRVSRSASPADYLRSYPDH